MSTLRVPGGVMLKLSSIMESLKDVLTPQTLELAAASSNSSQCNVCTGTCDTTCEGSCAGSCDNAYSCVIEVPKCSILN